jgi:hypothetical protein
MTSPLVSRSEALKRRTHHQFLPGFGYIAHSGPPELPENARGTKNCAPPNGTSDATAHLMQPPSGPPIRMVWVQSEGAWASPQRERGNRLAWTTSHLQKAGWEYLNPVPGAKPARTKKH